VDRKVRAGSIPASSTNEKIIYLYQMKKVLFIAVMVVLASCSNETSTSSKDSVYTDSINVDSLIKISEARIDTMSLLLEEIKH
jgi:hypothetical protein